MSRVSCLGSLVVLLAVASAAAAQTPRSKPPEGTKVYANLEYVPGGHERHRLDLFIPVKADGPLPVIVWIHGGAWMAGSKDGGSPALPFVAEGYAVASINYRLSQHALFPAQIEDCKAAIRWLRANAKTYNLDPAHIGAWGASAGGHLVALLGTSGGVDDRESKGANADQSSRVQAVVDFFGPTDFLQMDAHTLPGTRLKHDPPTSPESRLIGGPIHELIEKVGRANPIKFVTKDAPPFLIVHGEQDPLVPYHQSELLYEALKRVRSDATFYKIAGAGHGSPEFNSDMMRAAVQAFFDKHLKPPSDGSSTAPRNKEPVVFTTTQDRQNMLDQLGTTKLRPGRDSNSNSPNAANYDEAKANPYPKLPALLETKGGKKITSAEQWWKERRPEIVEMLEREVYGRIPENVPKVKWEVRETREVKAGGKPAIQRHIVGVVHHSDCPGIEVNISMSLTLPKEAAGLVPVLMSFGWTPFEPSPFNFRRRGGGPAPPSNEDVLIKAGWGCATLNPTTVQDDAGGWQSRRFGPVADPNAKPTGAGLTRGIIGLTNHGQPRTPDQWGALRAWAWGASRGLDYLETVPEVNAKRVGIAGVSRYGKAALVTLAFDQRFAMGLIASSGKGGTALYRRNFGESLENLATTGGYHWMAGNYLKYSAEESSFGRRTANDMPVDSHMTLALCAPRLTFISHGIPERGDAHWLDHQGSFMATIAAQPVFRLLGARDLGRSDDFMSEKMPAVNVDLLDGALAWRQHDGGHTDGPNVEHFIRWAEVQWGKGKTQDVSASPEPDRRSLKDAVGDRFKIGVGVSYQVVQQPEDAALIRKHFQILTPENCMKPQSIHPTENTWNFEPADRFAEFVRANKLEMVGHCLVWAKDDRTDEWMKRENGKPVSRETLLRRIEAHVETVVGRYADVATQWDVVNEAIGDGNEGLLRDSVYSRTTGIDFIVTAFKTARARDPDALLIYNDYNGHKPGKREKLIELLTQLKQKGAPVDAYGMQGHFELGDESIPQLRETFNQLRKLGIKVVVSELDIDVVTRSRWWADNGKYRDELTKHNPYKDGLPEAIQQKQIKQYVELFKLFDEFNDLIERVSFWNLHDGQSWLNYFPWNRVNHPLLFDRNRRPKPAFDAVYAVLRTPRSAHAPVERRVPIPSRGEFVPRSRNSI